MFRSQYFKLLFGLIAVLFASSCIQDDLDKLQQTNWNPELAFPLIDSRIGIDRIVSKYDVENGFTTDDDGVVVLFYNGNLFDIDADSIIKLENVSFDLAIIQNLDKVDYPSSNFLIKAILFESGSLRVHIEDDLVEDTRVILNLPETSKNGQAFKEAFTIKYEGLANTIFDTVFDISNYHMNLSEDGSERNRLEVDYEAFTVSNNDSVSLNQFILAFEDLKYEFMEGYLGKRSFGTHEDTLKLDIFKNFKSGRIILEDPKFNLEIENSFGIPIKLSFGNFDASGEGGNSSLDGNTIDNGIELGVPGTTGSTSTTNKEINKDNSNISEFLSITPEYVNFSVELEANADGDSSIINFVTNTSSLQGNLSLEIPLKGSLDSVIIEDLYEFNNSEMKNLENATFKMTTDNSFPVGIYVQIYFIDVSGNALDSLVQGEGALFREAITDENGFSIANSYEESYFVLERSRFNKVKDFTTDLKIKVMLLTDESKNKTVKITSDDYFDLKLGIRATLNR